MVCSIQGTGKSIAEALPVITAVVPAQDADVPFTAFTEGKAIGVSRARTYLTLALPRYIDSGPRKPTRITIGTGADRVTT